LLDQNYNSYWAPAEGQQAATVEVDFGKKIEFNRLLVQEYVNLGQRVSAFSIEKEVNGVWLPLAEGTTLGYKRILRVADTEAQRIRIHFKEGKGVPLISELGVYFAPPLLLPPKISRSKEGKISLTGVEKGLEIYFSLVDNQPKVGGSRYTEPLEVLHPVTVQALVYDPKTGQSSASARKELDLVKAGWKVISPDPKSQLAIDEQANTYWTSAAGILELDLGTEVLLKGITYLPMQARYPSGFIADYVLEGSPNGSSWQELARGEFANIQNSPVEQLIRFTPQQLRYVRLKAVRTVDGNAATFGELGTISR
jgi:alpha-L-fucosidase